ncbi:MAG: hypothetical protein LBB04_03800 [Oscillospiraceae bacterium]|jgi:hypothetical protein|nr:hypothetical protein [Oscillospiraceae bacterium]
MIISNNKRLLALLALSLTATLFVGGHVNALVSQKLDSSKDTTSFSIKLEKEETFGSVLSDIPKVMKDCGLLPSSGKYTQNIEIHFTRVPKGYLSETHEDNVIYVSKEGEGKTITINTEKLVAPFLSLLSSKDAKEVKKETKSEPEEVKEEEKIKVPFNIRIVWDNVSPSRFAVKFSAAGKEIPKNKKIAFHSAGKVVTVTRPGKAQKKANETEKVRKIENLIAFEEVVDKDEFIATTEVQVWTSADSKS